jgi:hypothetical protein
MAELRRLIDLPGIAPLEYQALLKSRMADLGAEAEFPEIDEAAKAAFGLSVTEAEDIVRPAGWDGIENKSVAAQVEAFEAAGWDVTEKRRPLRMLGVLAAPFWLAVRGVAGELPFLADTSEEDEGAAMLADLAKDVKAFRRDRV